jgi:hypothetical protein
MSHYRRIQILASRTPVQQPDAVVECHKLMKMSTQKEAHVSTTGSELQSIAARRQPQATLLMNTGVRGPGLWPLHHQ